MGAGPGWVCGSLGSWGFLRVGLRFVRGCWWFSLVAATSGGDTLIEPHYFQVCGTLRGHQCRGVPCVFNYCCAMKECNLSYVQVSITTRDRLPANQTDRPCPASTLCLGWKRRHWGVRGCVWDAKKPRKRTDRGRARGLINPSGKGRQGVPICFEIALCTWEWHGEPRS